MVVKNGQYKLGIEKRVTRVETILEEISVNHLPHLQIGIDNISIKIDSMKDEFLNRIENNKGIPQWVAVVFTVGGSILATLVTYVLTHVK